MKKAKRNKLRIDRSQQVEYDYHLPVFKDLASDYLVTEKNGIYIDGTLGGGGHAAEVLKRLGFRGKLLGFDKDEEAIEHCRIKFAAELEGGEDSRLVLVNECFSKACSIAKRWGETSGILLDLGVSSRQLDESRRGFSYRENAPIDLRFGSKGISAEQLINTASEEELESILRQFGEEPFAKVIARRIAQIRRVTPVKLTFQLRTIVEECVPGHLRLSSLSRVFQAFRIAINEELGVLGEILDCCSSFIAINGRIVVISYHSLEDRIVKNKFREKSKIQRTNNYALNKIANTVPELKILTPKPLIPDENEILLNPRARSAKMRVAEVLSKPSNN